MEEVIKLTHQQAFDKAAEHLMVQSARSMNVSGEICLYRGPRGLKCAVGALIEDSEYRPWFECNITPYFEDRIPRFGNIHDFLRQLQLIHDSADVDSWHDELIRLAMGRLLSWQVLEPWSWDSEKKKYVKKEVA